MLHPFRRLAPLLAVTVLTTPLSACGATRLDRALAVAPNLVTHQLCSAVFVAGADPDAYYRQVLGPDLAGFGPLVRHHVDRAKGEVTASLAGGFRSRAVYRGAEGCLVVQGPVRPPVAAPPPGVSLLPPIAGPREVTPTDPALIAALDRAFAQPASGPSSVTQAVVILHDGRVVAERYAPGFGVDTPLHGWSMTKSVTSALIGVLVRQGKLSAMGPAPVAAWSDLADPHHAISVDSLMRMTSGLEFGQSLTQNWKVAFDPTAQMVFATPDMAALPRAAPVSSAPGVVWRYANGNTLLLSRMIRDAAGGDAGAVMRFAHAELFDKLGMTHATLEFDAVGTPIGASHMWAPARDWARFGMLYLDDGVVGGQRILPPGWVDYSARLTPGSEAFGYGAGFWTNRGAQTAAPLHRAGMPRDAFFARGSLGQFVVIAPTARLVIVRMGVSRDRGEYIRQMDRLTADAVAVFDHK
jgi:CubicO group peptidase (beta-lactamase class C family)